MARRNRSAVGGVAANRRMSEMRRIAFVLITLALTIAAGPLSTAGANSTQFTAVPTSATVIKVTFNGVAKTSLLANANSSSSGRNSGTCSIEAGKSSCDITGLSPATSYSITITGGQSSPAQSVDTPKAAAPNSNLANTGAIKTGDVITVWWHAGQGVEDVEASATFTGSSQETCVQSNASSQSASGSATTTTGTSTSTSTATCARPRGAVISKHSLSIRLTSFATSDGSQSGLGRTQDVGLTLPSKPATPNSPSWWLFLLSGLVGLAIGVVVDRLVKTRRPAHIVDPALQHPQPGTTNGALAASSRTTPPPPAATLRKVAVLDGRPAPSEGRLVGVADPEGFAEFSDGIVRRVRMVDGRPGLPDEQVSPVQD